MTLPRLLPRTAWLGRQAGRIAGALLLAGALLAMGCSEVSYYWQAFGGQLEILQKRRPISEVLEDAGVAETTKDRLRLATDVQSFAVSALRLPRDGSYRYYADLGRDYVSWLVVATPELEMKEHVWCYPIAGCLGYRGFFHREDAAAFAAGLRSSGFDVLVRPVRAYSTLGWFDDPLLNTFVQQEPLDLTATLIHEHAHRRVWIKNDTEFNESFAVFVEQEGLRRFVEQKAPVGAFDGGLTPEARMTRYRTLREERDRFQAIALAGRDRLAELYATTLPDETKRTRKAEILESIRRDYQKQRASFTLLNYDEWFGPRVNNAYLAGIAQYHDRVEAFAALFEEQGRDFGPFYAACDALGRMQPPERQAALERLAAEYRARTLAKVMIRPQKRPVHVAP
jgi:predicted aminopeptidase